jgi:hypothetical protein
MTILSAIHFIYAIDAQEEMQGMAVLDVHPNIARYTPEQFADLGQAICKFGVVVSCDARSMFGVD